MRRAVFHKAAETTADFWKIKQRSNEKSTITAARSLQSFERRDAVIFLERGSVGGDLGSIELDLFRIFFGFDFYELVDRMLHRFGQIGQRLHLCAVHFLDDQVGEIVITNGGVGGQDLAKHDDFAMTFGEKFGLETIEVNESLGSFFLPVSAPFLQVLAR